MLTCPVCDTPNADGSVSCEHCNSAFTPDGETILSNSPLADQQTVAATAAFSHASTGSAAPAQSTELPPGRILVGRYEILARLGQGGMGTVYKVLDHELDRVIALKTIRADLASNSAALRRLRQETLLARQIAHRNVIRVFDLGVADKLRFITMEFVDGHDLKSVLDHRKKLPPGEAVEILTQICAGLTAAHSEDVVHRDLKPQNVLLSFDNRVRIVDFGLARSFEDPGITQAGMVLGTPAYMSPEQALGQHGDARSDIFSFGVIAFELLTGELPFPNQTLSESLLSRTRGRARLIGSVNSEIPAWLGRIVMRCLERNPSDRYASAHEIAAELTAADKSVQTLARPTVLSPGSMLGSRYRIEAEAGEGGVGRIYRATDLDLHRTVALKVVRPELAHDPHTLDLLIQEISVASQISHKNVLRIHDLGEANGLRFVSMAWAEGEDLGQLLRRTGSLPEARIIELATEICLGLEAAHEQGISHRDLKPDNILLTAGGHACVTDFGLALSANANPAVVRVGESASAKTGSQSSPVAGTPRYMSPEQVDGAPIDHRTDIYSLGLILYEMATGRIPFNDDSALQTMSERVTAKPVSPKLLNPEISSRLANVILRCLERDPDDRYPNVRALLTDLQGKPELALVPSLEFYPPKIAKIPRAWLYSAAGALILITAAVIVWYRRSHSIEPPVNGKYIAVLPFRPIGSDPNLKYRAEGIADAVSARLSSLNSVHPVSSSALERVNSAEPDEKIGKLVGANLLVKGTVQGLDDRLKVRASIFNIEKHKVLWSKSYEGVTADLFTMEDEICNDAVDALKVKPSIEEREREAPPPTQNLAAYDLYLKGRDILKNHRDAANARAALDLFEQACRQDPSFALAWTGIADASLLLYNIDKESTSAAKALIAAAEARNRNDKLPEVHFTLGSVYSATGKNAQAVEEIQHALQLAPNSDDGFIRLGKAYQATGQIENELKALKRAVELNRYYWYNHKQLGAGYFDAGRYDEAVKEFKEQIAENPNDPSGYNNLGASYLEQGRWKECIPAFNHAIELKPSFRTYTNLATAYHMLGRYVEAVPVYEKAVEMSPNQGWVVRNLAEAYRRAGQEEKSLKTYDRAISLLYDQLRVNPQDASALGDLALCYMSKGDPSQARIFISRARSIDASDNVLMYAAAVVESASGHIPEALNHLRNALRNGYSFVLCLSDPDLKAVRASPGFEALKREFAHAVGARRR